MNPERREPVEPMPLTETVCAALDLIQSATLDGPLAVVPTAALRRLEAAVDRLIEHAAPDSQPDEVCSN